MFGGVKMCVPDGVCCALLGKPLGVEDRLRLSGTLFLTVVDGTGCGTGRSDTKEGDVSSGGTSAARTTVHQMLSTLGTGHRPEEAGPPSAEDEKSEGGSGDGLVADAAGEEHPAEDAPTSLPVPTISALPTPQLRPPDAAAAEEWEPRCYSSELDYLNDQLSVVMQQIQISAKRLEQDLKEASVEPAPRWMRGSGGDAKKSSVGELAAKMELAVRKNGLRLRRTREEGTFYPRLEELVVQLGLDAFEKSVLLYLSGSMISPIFKSSIANDSYRGGARKCTVGDVLQVFCGSVAEQVAARAYFYRTARLVQKGLVRCCKAFDGSDLTDLQLQLDRRVLDCIVGLDKESTEVVQGSHLYNPTVDIESVVLVPGLKDSIIEAVENFDKFRAYRKRSDFDEAIAYGVGLTLMFCGPSGTGKTMTANAIASRVHKKILLVDFPRLTDGADGASSESRFQSVFREAELSDAILFFDECESLFAKRETGGATHVGELLAQLELFDGIVLLATNRPFDLDEAMYRRISEVFEFAAPNHVQRQEIWRLVTAHAAIPCEDDIDWEAVALQYELTGGFIKNAVLSALLTAVGRDEGAPMIQEADIIKGCKKQTRGALQMRGFDERVVPAAGLEDLIASAPVREHLRAIVAIEKARGVLFGMWGFDEAMRDRQGTTALFWGPAGAGKGHAAAAIGFELTKPLKVVDFPQLLGRSGKASAAVVRDCFREARLIGAVLVMSGFSDATENGGGQASAEDTRLLNLVVREMTRFPGIVIMMVDTVDLMGSFVSRLEKGLLDGLKFSVQFELPNSEGRELLWKKLLPASLPCKGINFRSLAKSSSNLNFVQIGNAVYRAAAAAALRSKENRYVKMEDLKAAVSDERRRGESAFERLTQSQYL